MMKPERRSSPRLNVQWQVPVDIPHWPEVEVAMRDVGDGGATLVVPPHVRVGDVVQFSSGNQHLEAQVVRLAMMPGGRVEAGLRWLAVDERSVWSVVSDLVRRAARVRPS